MSCIVPPPLTEGSRVAVLRPAAAAREGTYPEHLIELGLDRLAEFGLEPVAYDSLRADTRALYDDPEGRAAELERAFRDPAIDGIVAAIGGNDQLRVLRHLDPAVVRDHPTRFFGTSDNTSFAAFCRAQGVVTFYGGTLFTEICEPGGINDYTREYLDRAFFAESLGTLRAADRYSDEDLDWHDPANLERDPEYEPGARNWFGVDRVEGHTWGGCLEVVAAHAMADAYLPSEPAGSVFLLETSENLPNAATVRRVMTALGERGLLTVGAVLVGRAKARGLGTDRTPDERAAYRQRQREAIIEVVSEYNDAAVVVTDVEFGHARPTAPLPIGGECIVDATTRTIRFP